MTRQFGPSLRSAYVSIALICPRDNLHPLMLCKSRIYAKRSPTSRIMGQQPCNNTGGRGRQRLTSVAIEVPSVVPSGRSGNFLLIQGGGVLSNWHSRIEKGSAIAKIYVYLFDQYNHRIWVDAVLWPVFVVKLKHHRRRRKELDQIIVSEEWICGTSSGGRLTI